MTVTRWGETIVGKLSGRKIFIPDVNAPPMPLLVGPGVIQDGRKAEGIDVDPGGRYPDVLGFWRKFSLLIPATNTTVESELWGMIGHNRDALKGLGLHTCNVSTPKPQLRTAEDLLQYKKQFLDGLEAAVDQALLAQPQYLIMGMSLEHILGSLDEIRAPVAEIEAHTGLTCAAWHDAAAAALRKYGAKRIGLLTPFDKNGNENATRVFTELGFEVVTSVGFSCANAIHIAHIPDAAKEKAARELLATKANKLDALVQCGTNMSMTRVAEKLEPRLGIPILGINATLLWYALRENGFTDPMTNAGRLFREF